MRIIRSGDTDRIDFVAHFIEHFAVVAKCTSMRKFLFGYGDLSRVNVAERHDIFVGHLRQIAPALAWSDANECNIELTVRRLPWLPNREPRQNKRTSSKKRRSFQKLAATRGRS